MQFVIVMAYLVLLLVGLYLARRRVKDGNGSMVAGRSYPRMVPAGSVPATFVGSGVILGGASFVYQYGPLAAIFFLAGAPIGVLIFHFFLANRLPGLAKHTVPEILEIRYGVLARASGGICILLAYVGIASYQFTGGGYVLNMTTGVPAWLGTLIFAVAVIFLATVGGIVSVLYTNAIGTVLIFGVLLIGLPRILGEVGGLAGLFSGLPEERASWNGGLSIPQLLGYFLPLFLLLLGGQNVYQRLSPTENGARRAAIGSLAGAAVVLLVILVATCSIVLLPIIDPDTAILSLTVANVMPTALCGLLLAAVAGVMITTGNSYLLCAAGNLVHDVYVKLSRREMPEASGLHFDRAAVVLLGALACTLGILFHDVLALQVYSYTIYGAGITPALVATLLWRRATVAGVVASIMAGTVATLTWELILRRPMEYNSVIVALPLSVTVLVVVSLVTGKREPTGESTEESHSSA